MTKLSFLKKILKSFSFFALVSIFSSYAVLSSVDVEVAGSGVRSPFSMKGVAKQLKDVEGDVPETLRQERLRSWNEKLPERAAAWGMSEEEYLKKANEYIAHFKRRTHILYGVEDLIPRYLPEDLEEYNKAWKHTGRTYTRDSFPMFGLPSSR
ncbi:MAG: hypothetical protein K2W94_04305 [Alphaproteobacteria bacterium]|nr:hypothetical protein [Alphaproteobacteria bacterium]